MPEDLDDARLEALLFPPPSGTPADQRPMPDWAGCTASRPDATLALAPLWEEYRAGAPDGFGYSWFCDLYRAWAGRLKPTMRQVHLAESALAWLYLASAKLLMRRLGRILHAESAF